MEIHGTLPDGRTARIFTLANKNGLRARVTEFGARLVSMEAPDRTGCGADIVHGYDTFEDWLADPYYFGASVGRFGNRIADGRFTLDGKEYQLATNNDPGGIPCHLHGGTRGFDRALWSGRSLGAGSVEFSLVSPDGEEGYPGTLSVKVIFTLTEADELVWRAEATTDAPTILNIIHHPYWNLSGDPTTTIDDHELLIAAGHFLPTTPGLIPTGELVPVVGTPMDFTTPVPVGERIDADFQSLEFGAGYDHCWALRSPGENPDLQLYNHCWVLDGENAESGETGAPVRFAARVRDPKSGRVMEIFTDQPGIQFYSGNFLDGKTPGKNGVAYAARSALCLETENFPDAPNHPEFPSPVLRPGETYRHTMVHRFSCNP
jgi:aldose 1-epimerase